ncbi:MAG: DUF58 domain-containing protein [Chloroflexi bacterium]|nr:DUF58 domain-containing protein [Chloroflexota bacterium]
MNNSHGHLELRTRLLPPLVILLMILQLTTPFRGWMILLVGLGGAWLIAFVWARSLARHLTLTRQVRFGWAQVGDHIEERFTLINRGVLPALWVEVSDHSTLPDYNASQATGIGGDTETRWLLRTRCARRGAYTLGPTTIRAGDPFGIYQVTLDLCATQSMLVLPPVVPLPGIQIAPGGRIGEGHLRRTAIERAVNAAAVREYQPGDSVNAIHWRTSARRDDLFVRQFDHTPSGDWWVVLDLNERVQAGQGADSTTEHGVILAASLADAGLRARRAVGLVASARDSIWLAPRDDAAQRWDILGALALAQPGDLALRDVLTRARTSLRQSSSLIIITSDATNAWVDALPLLLWRGIVPTVILLDPRSFGGAVDARGVANMLARIGIARHIVTRDMLARRAAMPGQAGAFDWRVTPHGRAVLARSPRDAAWKTLV